MPSSTGWNFGRGADEAQVRRWLVTAAGVPGFIGFAVGRTTFWDALFGWQAQALTRVEAVVRIARWLREWVDTFESARMAHPTVASRPSGTENIYKIYAESFLGAEHLKRLLQEAQTIVDRAISPAPSS